MTINDDFKNALNDFSCSTLLNADRALSALLAETAENAELCDYIEKNGSHVNFKAELNSSFGNGKYYADSPKTSVPFIYGLLYLLDSKKIALESFLETAYSDNDIDVAYRRFVFTTASTLKKAFADIDLSVSESEDTAAETSNNNDDDILNAIKSYLSVNLSGDDATNAEYLVNNIKSSIDCGNTAVLKGLYNALKDIVDTHKLDPDCLSYIESQLRERAVI